MTAIATGISFLLIPVLAVIIMLYIKWISFVLDRFEDHMGLVICMSFMPFTLLGVLLIAIGLLTGEHI